MVPVVDALKVEGTSIVEILSGENNVLEVARMSVRDRVTWSKQVNLGTTNKCAQHSRQHTHRVPSSKA